MDDFTDVLENIVRKDLLIAVAIAVFIIIVTAVLSRLAAKLVRKLMQVDGSPVPAGSIMVNAVRVAGEFDGMLPKAERPEHTEGREGFYRPTTIEGTASDVTMSYIIRDFDSDTFEHRQQTMRDAAAFLNSQYGEGTVEVSFKQQYRNMAERFEGVEFLIENALEAHREIGIEPVIVPVRGGTDGAQLTFRGLPCPNIATGAYNFHSVREFVPVNALEVTVDLLEHLVAKFAVPQGA